jgi:hypothetical protein
MSTLTSALAARDDGRNPLLHLLQTGSGAAGLRFLKRAGARAAPDRLRAAAVRHRSGWPAVRRRLRRRPGRARRSRRRSTGRRRRRAVRRSAGGRATWGGRTRGHPARRHRAPCRSRAAACRGETGSRRGRPPAGSVAPVGGLDDRVVAPAQRRPSTGGVTYPRRVATISSGGGAVSGKMADQAAAGANRQRDSGTSAIAPMPLASTTCIGIDHWRRCRRQASPVAAIQPTGNRKRQSIPQQAAAEAGRIDPAGPGEPPAAHGDRPAGQGGGFVAGSTKRQYSAGSACVSTMRAGYPRAWHRAPRAARRSSRRQCRGGKGKRRRPSRNPARSRRASRRRPAPAADGRRRQGCPRRPGRLPAAASITVTCMAAAGQRLRHRGTGDAGADHGECGAGPS